MKNFNKLFPILNQYTYLNTPGSGLLSVPVMEWRHNHDLDFLVGGSILKAKQGTILTEVREKVGHLFNCPPNRVALVPNFSYGFNTLLEGITRYKKVLLLQQDYPSVNWPFISRDFDITYVSINGSLEDTIAQAFAKVQPDIFSFSLVQWLNGIKIDQRFLKELKSKYPDTLFFADATQYAGTELFDFDNSALDVLGASTYKWLNAGYGNAFFLFKERVSERVAPNTTGFNSLQGRYKPQEGNFIGRFEPGHQDTLNYGSLGAAIDVIHKIGMPHIQDRIEYISSLAREEFVVRGLLEEAVLSRNHHSNIFNIKGDEALLQKLSENAIIALLRGDGIRVGFQYFNTKEDLERLVELL